MSNFQHEGLDLSGLPVSYLEAYPFPALVVPVPIPQKRPRLVSRDTDITVRHYEDTSPFSGPGVPRRAFGPVVWANEKWLSLTEGRSPEDYMDSSAQEQLQIWAEGDERLTGAQDDSVFLLEMRSPAHWLTLVKAVVPMSPPSATHALCIITSQRQTITTPSDYVSASPGTRSSTTSSDAYSYFTNSRRQSTSTEMRTSFSTDLGPSASQAASPSAGSSTESYFSRSRSERRPRPRRQVRPSEQSLQSIEPLAPAADEYWKLVESVDWSQTSIGPRHLWAEVIDPILSIVFASKTQDCVWVGQDLNMLYNQHYAPLVDHPKSYGRPGSEVWGRLWPYLEPAAQRAMNGIPTYRENDLLDTERFGRDNAWLEKYHSWRFIPIQSSEGKFMGIYNISNDTTEQMLAERRLGTIRELSEHMLVARTTKEYFASIGEVLGQNPADSPFALAYSVHPQRVEGPNTVVDVRLETAVGVPKDHDSAPQKLTMSVHNKVRSGFGPNIDRMSSPTLSAISALSSGSGRAYQTSEGHSWPISKALSTRQCVIVDDCQELVKGFPIRQWDHLPTSAIVVPVCSDSSTEIPEAVLIIGLNYRRPFDGDYDSWVHVIRAQLASTLTSVKSYEAEQKRHEDAARMEKAKAAWFRGAAHDLRSPLTLISGPIEDLLDTPLNVSQRVAAQTAKRNVERLMRLVNALMDFSRLEAGRVEGRFLPTDLGAFVADLATIFRPAIERAKIRFDVQIQKTDKLVYIDPVLFETVVSNMIGNALKYTEAGSIVVKVSYTGENAEIAVTDTGVGIPADEVPHVAEWFHRATTAIHSGTQGTGLGLALVKELLHLHQGELLVQSKVASENNGQHGSTFTARVPMAARHVVINESQDVAPLGAYGKAVANEAMRWTRETRDNESEATSEGGASETQTATSSRLSDGLMFHKSDTILLCDDNLDMREYIKQIFSPFCHVIEARDGQDALAKALAKPPNLIIADYMMPKMNGLELLEEIRKNDKTKIIPMIIMSAVSGEDTKVDALIMGAEDYIAKPFKPKELLARVNMHMQLGKKRAKLERLYAEREAEIRVIADYCPSGIMKGDAEGRLTYVNGSWRRQSGLLNGEDPDTWPQFVDPETAKRLFAEWIPWTQGTHDQPVLRLNWKWAASGRSVAGVFVRLDMVEPGMEGVLGCLTDTTYEEERIAEAERRRLEAEESKHQQELLIDLTSHEIRTPVSAILQCSSLVKENLTALAGQLKHTGKEGFRPTPELLEDLSEDIEALESIYQCGLVQERIAGDVLSLARIQLDMLTLHDIEADLRREARKVISVFSSEAKSKKIELFLEFGESLEQAKVYGVKTDPVRLGQVVTNLISNAIRFTASSDVRKITVRYDVSFNPPEEETCAVPADIGLPDKIPAEEDTNIWLFVSVRDTGPGLGPKELAMLFKRFSQGNKMIHTRYGGSGLGLFICRKITELLGGRIEVQSQLGEGSVFRFFVQTRTTAPPPPMASLLPALLTQEPTPSPGGTVSPGPNSSFPMVHRSSSVSSAITSTSDVASSSTPAPEDQKDLHILIVEDNIINQTVLKRQIIKAGLTCDDNGLIALNLIREADRQSRRSGPGRKKAYNVVLMDLEMPVMDGLTAVREIRMAEEAGALKRQMVIALTGNARQGQIDQAMAAGMDDVVIKPYVLSNLLKKIKDISATREREQREGILESTMVRNA